MSGAHVFNMPAGADFLPALAAGLQARFKQDLPKALILLPTRRAVRQFSDILSRGGGVHRLPDIRPLADIDPDEPPFEPGYLTGLVNPAMPSLQRRLALSELMARYHEAITGQTLDAAGRLALTDPLIAILDDAALEGVRFKDLHALEEIKAFAAEHYQNALDLFKIIQDYWPAILSESQQMEPMARRVALLDALTDLWLENPPDYPVIIAGSTGTLKATARLMRCAAHLEQGCVILPGLDRVESDDVWRQIADDHPQNSLKNLLATIGIDRTDVPDWPVPGGPLNTARRRMISESLVPVESTSDWPSRIAALRAGTSRNDFFDAALDGLSIIEAATDEEEALLIALMMREALETQGHTAALVTPDPALARRVKSRLMRWDIDVDYSQGQPLEEARIGTFLTGLLNLAQDFGHPVHLAFLSYHTLTGMGQAQGQWRKDWQKLEKAKFRGVRPSAEAQAHLELIQQLSEALATLRNLDGLHSAPVWARGLAEAAEALAATDEEPGAARLWVGDDGEKAASLIEEIMAYADKLEPMSLPDFAELFSLLLRGRVVRPRFGTEPRLQILGPLEARMLSVGKVILGGLNEGTWPAAPGHMPFLSRGMRRAMHLSLPERRYGLSAHDFSLLACYPDVTLTRSARSAEGPRVASRWIWRLQTLLKGAYGEEAAPKKWAPETPYLDWARAMDAVAPDKVIPAEEPKPAPPVEARWPDGKPQLSLTQIKTWIRDPYSIYCRKVLRLKPLDALDEPLGPLQYGTAIHDGIEAFTKTYGDKLPAGSERHLQASLEKHFIKSGYEEHDLVRERPRFESLAGELVAWMRSRRAEGWQVGLVEKRGEIKLDEVDFALTGKADLIEKSAASYAVIDYKTGAPASAKEVAAGFDPQLPLTAYMLEKGGFGGLKAEAAEQLIYVRARGSGDGMDIRDITDTSNKRSKNQPADVYVDMAADTLVNLAKAFADPNTPYLSQPRIKYTHDYSDFDDLARRGEWAQIGDDKEGGS